MTSRILGLVRDQVLAALFGAGAAMDAFNVAFRLPNLLRDLFAEGAMSAAFVPTFTHHLAVQGTPSAWRLGRLVITALLLVTGLLVLLGIVFAEPIIRLMTAEEYSRDASKLALTVQLSRIMLPSLTMIALAAAVMGMLNALHHFFIPAVSPAMFNIVTIVCAVALVPLMPGLGLEPIVAIAIGTFLGTVAQLMLQWPTLRREGFRFAPSVDWSDPGLRRVLMLMGPGTVGLAATQVNLLVNQWLASGEGEGAVSWLAWAFRLMYLPIGLFGVSIASATLPAVSRFTARRDDGGVRDTLANGMSLMFMLNVPAAIGLMVLAEPIVRVIFERKAFLPADTLATAVALQCYAVGLLGYSVVRIASPAFYALGMARTPVAVSIVTVLVNAGLNIWLVREIGYAGLALGTSIAAIFNAMALLLLLRRRLGGLNDARLLGAFMRITVAASAMGVATAVAYGTLSDWLPGGALLSQIVRLAGAIGIALVVLAASAHALRISEFQQAFGAVTRRFRRSPR
jgi:putative peptidoglycan lipid II flippase